MNNVADITETTVAPDLPRRKFLAIAIGVSGSVATLPAAPANAGGPSNRPDAVLIALGDEFDAAVRRWRRVWKRWSAADYDFRAQNPLDRSTDIHEWFSKRDAGYLGKLGRCNDHLLEKVEDIRDAILATPASGIGGFAVKIRVVLGEKEGLSRLIHQGHVSRDELDHEDELLFDLAVEMNRVGLGREHLI